MERITRTWPRRLWALLRLLVGALWMSLAFFGGVIGAAGRFVLRSCWREEEEEDYDEEEVCGWFDSFESGADRSFGDYLKSHLQTFGGISRCFAGGRDVGCCDYENAYEMMEGGVSLDS